MNILSVIPRIFYLPGERFFDVISMIREMGHSRSKVIPNEVIAKQSAMKWYFVGKLLNASRVQGQDFSSLRSSK
jgi:hypothetical protein